MKKIENNIRKEKFRGRTRFRLEHVSTRGGGGKSRLPKNIREGRKDIGEKGITKREDERKLIRRRTKITKYEKIKRTQMTFQPFLWTYLAR